MVTLPRCHRPKQEKCRFRKKLEEEFRCAGVQCLKIECPHLGKIEPRKSIVREKVKREEELQQIVEEPPMIEV